MDIHELIASGQVGYRVGDGIYMTADGQRVEIESPKKKKKSKPCSSKVTKSK